MVNGGEKFDDHGCPNRWRWEWISEEVEIREVESVLNERVGRRLHKIDVKGQAWCLLCECTVSYASRGLRNLTDHFQFQTKKHVKRVRGVLNNQRLPGKAIYFIHNYVLSELKLERKTQLDASLGKKTSKRTEKEKLLEEEIVEEPPTSRRVNPQKRVLEKTRQKSVGPAEKKTKADSDSGSRDPP